MLKNSPKDPAVSILFLFFWKIFLETLLLLRMVSMDGTKCAGSLRWSKIRNTLASTVVLRSTQDVSLDLFTRQNDLKIW